MPQTTTYTWDEENRLESVTVSGGASESFTYSAEGLRRSKAGGGGNKKFLWDGQNVLQERSASPVPIAHYSNLPDGYGPLVSARRTATAPSTGAKFNTPAFGTAGFNASGAGQAGEEQSSFYSFDSNANTRVLTDLEGSAAGSFVSTAFGKEVSASGTVGNPYRFGGDVGYYSDGSGLSYVRARYLSSGQGRWVSRDPIGFVGGDWNLYRYVGNNPPYWLDPSGLVNPYAVALGIAVVGGIGYYVSGGPDVIESGYRDWTPAEIEDAVRQAGPNGNYPLFLLGPVGKKPSDYWDELREDNPRAAAAYIKAMLRPLENQLRASAYKNCVPVWLLASVILAELIDRNYNDIGDMVRSAPAARNRGAVSIGPAQLQINRALAHRPPRQRFGHRPRFLIDIPPGGWVDVWEETGKGTKTPRRIRFGNEDWARTKLLQGGSAIEAAAREISFLIDEILDPKKRGISEFRQWAVNPNASATTCDKLRKQRCSDRNFEKLIRCNCFMPGVKGKKSRILIETDPRKALIKAIAFAYNSYDQVNKPRMDLDSYANGDMQSDLVNRIATFIGNRGIFQTK